MEKSLEISIIIPAYNEETRLTPTLQSAHHYFSGLNRSFEIVVVDDGSTDRTRQIVETFAARYPQVKVVSLAQNRGKGFAVKHGVQQSAGALVLFADADGSTPFVEFPRLEEAVKKGADVAIGSRALPSTDTKVTTAWHRKLLGRAFNFFANLLLVPGIADTQCGFKLFTAGAGAFLFSRQTAERFSFDIELVYMAKRAGIAVAEVPVNWTNVAGSKVNLLIDAARMFKDLIVFRWRHRKLKREDFKKVESSNFRA